MEKNIGIVCIVIMLIGIAYFAGLFSWIFDEPTNSPPINNSLYVIPIITLQGKDVCEGEGGSLLFGAKASCEVILKNEEKVPVQIKPAFQCFTLTTLDSPKIIELDTDALAAAQSKTYKIDYDNNNKDWKCKFISSNPEKIIRP